MNGLKESAAGDIDKALASPGRKKGLLLTSDPAKTEALKDIYFLNNEANQLVMERIRNGEIDPTGFKAGKAWPGESCRKPSDIFTFMSKTSGC